MNALAPTFRAAMVIARRDFVATVWTKTFLLFLLAPILAIGFSVVIGELTEEADAAATRPVVAVAMEDESAALVQAAFQRIEAAVGERAMPRLRIEAPAPDPRAQAQLLLSSREENVSAVLTGALERPTLTGPPKSLDALSAKVALVLEDARKTQALARGAADRPVEIAKVATAESAGSLNLVRHLLARGAQFIVFFLNLMLATMLLSNLVEEKSNKVIEVLAAAVPLDAVFLGKLMAMLGVTLVGLAVWGAIAGFGLYLIEDFISVPVKPAVGWPAFVALIFLYFAANYLLLGALFLGIGGQASNVREVQTLAMPISFAQIVVLLLASLTVGDNGGTITWLAAIFPLSSPLTMVALSAQSAAIWPHLLALVWQLFWVVVLIRVSARMFRATVLKSTSREGFFAMFRRT
jgi:ABC-2 type transport system permease protein